MPAGDAWLYEAEVYIVSSRSTASVDADGSASNDKRVSDDGQYSSNATPTLSIKPNLGAWVSVILQCYTTEGSPSTPNFGIFKNGYLAGQGIAQNWPWALVTGVDQTAPILLTPDDVITVKCGWSGESGSFRVDYVLLVEVATPSTGGVAMGDIAFRGQDIT